MIIIDIEASGLATESYPIEIAWQHRYDPRLYDSFFIRPIPEWTYWDPYAEEHIHHISRSTLLKEGIDAGAAALRLNAALKGFDVYSDAPDYDGQWLNRLFTTAQIEKQFRVLSVYSLVAPSKVVSYQDRYAQSGVEHRALSDVREMIECLDYFTAW